MKQFKLYNIIVGWTVFIIATVTYLLTIEPTTSFWDCGEFIATAFKLEVGHPPGAPFFLMLARLFALFAGDNVQNVALMINAMSAIASSFTILFLFWTITHIAKKIIVKAGEEISSSQIIAILSSGIVGALSYTFSDSFWFSAVEGEVYALSSLFTAVVFWAILKWENEADQTYANRWIILIAYLMGLSIGVHLLNLLAIPAIVFVVYFKKFKPSPKGIVMASIISVSLLASIMYGIIQGVIAVAAKFELFFVNELGFAFNTGLLFYLLLVVSLFVLSLILTYKRKKDWITIITSSLALILLGIPFMTSSVLITLVLMVVIVFGAYYLVHNKIVIMNSLLLIFAVIFIGYTSFAMIVIRSQANPPMDENNPENVFSLLSYLNREQYGDRPLFYGQTYDAPLIKTEEGKNVYTPGKEKYIVVDTKTKYEYDKRFMTIFPRMYSWQESHKSGYKSWANITGKEIEFEGRDGTEKIIKPTFGENLQFLFNYQIGHMYFRYFLWNFAGRQNDIQGHGNYHEGNWISGIPFFDDARLGTQANLPDRLLNNKARNTYFFLPLLLGLLGLFFTYLHRRKSFWVIMLLFVFTGLAIVAYLNQTPYQPRERDYAYSGSFYAFAIWIGLGVLYLYQIFKTKINGNVSGILSGLIALVLVPGVLLTQNWDDHDRSNRYTARDLASNYLNSCDENAILFTYGDNDTFPLWYAQEVEGIRTDIRVVNLSLLAADWYINQLKLKAYDSEVIPFSMTPEKYREGSREQIPLLDKWDGALDLRKAIHFLASDNPETQISAGKKDYHFLPSKTFSLSVDSAKVIANGTVPKNKINKIEKDLIWKINKNSIGKNDMIVLDILAQNNWERPIYFAISAGKSNYLSLTKYFRQDGFAYRLVPYKTEKTLLDIGGLDSEVLYNRLMELYKWGGMNEPNVFMDEHNKRVISLLHLRKTFAALAIKLIGEGENEKAEKVLDKIIEVMPVEKFSYQREILSVIEAYYVLEKTEKANDLVKILAKSAGNELDYCLSLSPEQAVGVTYEAQISMHILQRLRQLSETYKQTEINEQISTSFEEFYPKYEKLY